MQSRQRRKPLLKIREMVQVEVVLLERLDTSNRQTTHVHQLNLYRVSCGFRACYYERRRAQRTCKEPKAEASSANLV